jgi:lipopolysaccharide transport system ATP-binding protein
MKNTPVIILENCTIEIPIFHAEHFSLRTAITKRNKKTIYVNCIDKINLTINSGDVVGLYGPNGSGKTTLLRTISGGYYPTSGQIKTRGTINNLIETGIGIDPESSGYENIGIKLNFLNYPHKKINEMRKSIIEFSELGDFIFNPVKTYSTGMLMRLTFSIVTSIKSEILLLDEWLSVGDEKFMKKADERMQEISSQASILVIASHNLEMLKNICNRIVYLNSGKIESISEL